MTADLCCGCGDPCSALQGRAILSFNGIPPTNASLHGEYLYTHDDDDYGDEWEAAFNAAAAMGLNFENDGFRGPYPSGTSHVYEVTAPWEGHDLRSEVRYRQVEFTCTTAIARDLLTPPFAEWGTCTWTYKRRYHPIGPGFNGHGWVYEDGQKSGSLSGMEETGYWHRSFSDDGVKTESGDMWSFLQGTASATLWLFWGEMVRTWERAWLKVTVDATSAMLEVFVPWEAMASIYGNDGEDFIFTNTVTFSDPHTLDDDLLPEAEAMLDEFDLEDIGKDYSDIYPGDIGVLEFGSFYELRMRGPADGIPLEFQISKEEVITPSHIAFAGREYLWFSTPEPSSLWWTQYNDDLAAGRLVLYKCLAELNGNQSSLLTQQLNGPPPPSDEYVPPDYNFDGDTDCTLDFSETPFEFQIVKPDDVIYEWGRAWLLRSCAGQNPCDEA